MKGLIFVVCLIVLCMGQLIDVEGGRVGLTVQRHPFYEPIAICSADFTIESPTNTTYHTNQIDINLTVTGDYEYCRYRIHQDGTIYGWNTIDCENDTVTLSQGYQTMEVQVVDNACTISKSVTFTVWEFRGEVAEPFDYFLLLGLVPVLFFFFYDDEDMLGDIENVYGETQEYERMQGEELYEPDEDIY